jgi:hypothetical protein
MNCDVYQIGKYESVKIPVCFGGGGAWGWGQIARDTW